MVFCLQRHRLAAAVAIAWRRRPGKFDSLKTISRVFWRTPCFTANAQVVRPALEGALGRWN